MTPSHARVIIVGAGIAGASIALHLARLGFTDTLVLDAGDLVGGTTSHAPGLVGQLRSSVSLTRMLMHSTALYRTLSVDGIAGFEPVGSLRLASTRERMTELRRQEGFARGVGLEAHLLDTAEAVDLFPLVNPRGVLGALYLPTDGSATASILARAAIAEAAATGVSFAPHTPVTGFILERGSVRGVHTAEGTIDAEHVVIAAGIWSALLARIAGISLPLTPMQHQYTVSAPLPDLAGRTLPNARDPDNLVYVRQRGDAFVAGGYERTPLPYDAARIGHGEASTVLPFDPTQFEPLAAAIGMRFPLLAGAHWAQRTNGLESFTPDGEFLLGPAPTVGGLWFACGFCAHGVSGAGGVGRMIAEWIVQGEPSLDLWHMDVRRFGGYASGGRYVRDRATEVYASYYDIHYPGHERSSARRLRQSTAAPELDALGVAWGERAGWERPNWFTPNAALVAVPWSPRGWPARHYSPAVEAEHMATRTRAGLFDVTSFSKIEVGGPGALPFLQHLAANTMEGPIGSVTYTQLLNDRGGIECDVTVTRLEAERFRIITGTAFGTHDLAWIRNHLPHDGSVYAVDVTSSLCCIGLWGPVARDILSAVTDDDLANDAFPYLTTRRISVGAIPVDAVRVTYVGELGWELYAPMEYGRALWRALWEAAEPRGALPAGYRAIESLRLEKGYRYWSTDIHSEHTPLEAGLAFAVRLKKGDFIGRDALLRQREEGLHRKLCCLTLADPSAVVLGNEPLLVAGEVVGRVTSGGYGHAVKASIAYAYLPPELATPGTSVDILWFGESISATVVRTPLYDPSNDRVKGVIPVTTT
jgi:4-methylaminobutanoate oxidase (formaldehyde-forming)